MRFLTRNNMLDLNAKGAIADSNSLTPWFMHPNIAILKNEIVFGHWASLEGKTGVNHVHALDTGCVWGNGMTLMELKTKNLFIEK